jgi:hypothetical protein
MFASLLILASLFPGSPPAPAAVDQIVLSRDDLYPAGLCLVKAEAVSSSSLRVIHVYVGPKELKNQTFTPRFDPPVPRSVLLGQGLSLSGPFPVGSDPLCEGDVGLFWLRQEKPAGKLHLAQAWGIGHVLKGAKDFETNVRLAEVRESIYRESDERRVRRIDTYVKSKDSEEALTAIQQLTWHRKNLDNPRIVAYLLGLARDPTLAVFVQMHIHDALSSTKGWRGSPVEQKMVERWFAEAWEGAEGALDQRLMRWFSAGIALKHYTASQELSFAMKGLASLHRSTELKTQLFEMARRARESSWPVDQQAAAFAALAKSVQAAPNKQEKAAAAKLLGVFAPFGPAQTTQLRTILAATTDDPVARELRALLGE